MSTHHAVPSFADWALPYWPLGMVSRLLRSIPPLMLINGRILRLNHGTATRHLKAQPRPDETTVMAWFINLLRPDKDRFYPKIFDDVLTNYFQTCSDVTNWLNTWQTPVIRTPIQGLARSPRLGSSGTDSNSWLLLPIPPCPSILLHILYFVRP